MNFRSFIGELRVAIRIIEEFVSHVIVRAVLCSIVGSAIFGGQNSVEAAPTEYQVKAAFLFNFAKFIEWPPPAFGNSQSPFAICVLGQDPFGKDLEETVRTQNIGARGFSVRRIAQAPRDSSCQMVFVSSSEESRFAQIIEAMKALPILTVGEENNFTRAGGIISFIYENDKIRFEVNLDFAEKAGIKISSKLLKLAKKVHERGKD